MNDRNDNRKIIDAIGYRTRKLADELGIDYPMIDILMDVEAAHRSVPLDLRRLLESSNPDFAHDVFGIRRHLDRSTGELIDNFLPRFAKKAEVSA